jgi:transcriptional regulator with XRE-family HTH domain
MTCVARHNVTVMARSTMTESEQQPVDETTDSAAYAKAVGSCLRRVRQQLRLSLQAVEAMSGQEFKASVLGAYERGERAISVPRLQRLAILYDVPVDVLLPRPRRTGPSAQNDGPIDLEARIASVSGPEQELLRRFIKMIQAQRRGGAGSGTAIRSDDIRAIELLLGTRLPETGVAQGGRPEIS